MRCAGDLFQAAAEGDEQFVELMVGSGGLTPNVADYHAAPRCTWPRPTRTWPLCSSWLCSR